MLQYFKNVTERYISITKFSLRSTDEKQLNTNGLIHYALWVNPQNWELLSNNHTSITNKQTIYFDYFVLLVHDKAHVVLYNDYVYQKSPQRYFDIHQNWEIENQVWVDIVKIKSVNPLASMRMFAFWWKFCRDLSLIFRLRVNFSNIDLYLTRGWVM